MEPSENKPSHIPPSGLQQPTSSNETPTPQNSEFSESTRWSRFLERTLDIGIELDEVRKSSRRNFQGPRDTAPLFAFRSLCIWFVVMALACVVVVGLTVAEFVQRSTTPLAQFEISPVDRLTIPTVTICPVDRAVPFFQNPNARLGFDTRPIMDLYQYRLENGTTCSVNDACYKNTLEQGWLGDRAEKCERLHGTSMSVSDYSNVSFLTSPCKYCWRLNNRERRFTTQNYLFSTETAQLQSAAEFFNCVYDADGIPFDRLGTTKSVGSWNHRIATVHLEGLRREGVLEIEDDNVGGDINFSSEQMCNVLLFSGYFLPSVDQGKIRYRWDASESEWEEIEDSSNYYRLKTTVTVMYTGGFEMYFEDPSTVAPWEELENQSISLEETAAERRRKPVPLTLPFLGERHDISPRNHPVRAPVVVVGGHDLSFITLTRQLHLGTPLYTWRTASSSLRVPLISPHSNNVEWGFINLLEERFFWRVDADKWGFFEDIFGWVGVFTGLSFFSAYRIAAHHYVAETRVNRNVVLTPV